MASSDTNYPRIPPPPPHILRPPPPPPITPPPSPPSPDNGPAVIVIIFISFGGLIFLAFLAIALCCCIKKAKMKKKKMVQETDIIRVDEHLKVKEGVVQGPHGMEAVALAIEGDVHVVEEIKKNEMFVEGKHVKPTDNISSAIEEGTSTSSSGQHQYLERNNR